VAGTIGLFVGILSIDADALERCRATNLTQVAPSRSSLQAAIAAADPGDEILVEGVCRGTFTIDRDLTVVGRRDPLGVRPVLHGGRRPGGVVWVGARVALKNLRVTGGVARGGGRWDGGGIFVSKSGMLTLIDSVVSGNEATTAGGGITNAGRLVLNGASVVAGNLAPKGDGGGIANLGVLILDDSASVRGNRSESGGGIFNSGTLIMNGSSSVRRNTAEVGGGISLEDGHPLHPPHPEVTMNDSSSVRRNTADHEGGGLFVGDGTVTLNGSSSVTGNEAEAGGGIYRNPGDAVRLNGSSSVAENSAEVDQDISVVRQPEPPDLLIAVEGLAAVAFVTLLAVGAAFIRRPWLSRIVLPTATGFLALTIVAVIGLPIVFYLFDEQIAEQVGEPGWGGVVASFLTGWAIAWGIGVMAGAWLGHVLRHRASGRQTDEENASSAGWALVVLIVMAVPASILALMVPWAVSRVP
jgi:hypothetical protein